MSWVSAKNIYLEKAYVDCLVISEWLCRFFNEWEGKNDCLSSYLYILSLKANFRRVSPKFIQKWAAKLEKLPKTLRGWLGTAYVTGIPPPTIIEYVKAKWRIFWKIGYCRQNPFNTKILGRFWPKNSSKRREKATYRPRSTKKRFFDPNSHLDPIWNRFRSCELQKVKIFNWHRRQQRMNLSNLEQIEISSFLHRNFFCPAYRSISMPDISRYPRVMESRI